MKFLLILCEPVEGQPGRTRIMQSMLADPKGSIPKSVVNMAAGARIDISLKMSESIVKAVS